MVTHAARRRRPVGFTVIELLVVLAAIGLLLAVAAPRYVQHVDAAREVALKHNLRAMREAIDKFHADHGRYPESLQELVARRYLRAVPDDPVAQRPEAWRIVPPAAAEAGKVYDVRSSAAGRAMDGSDYAGW